MICRLIARVTSFSHDITHDWLKVVLGKEVCSSSAISCAANSSGELSGFERSQRKLSFRKNGVFSSHPGRERARLIRKMCSMPLPLNGDAGRPRPGPKQINRVPYQTRHPVPWLQKKVQRCQQGQAPVVRRTSSLSQRLNCHKNFTYTLLRGYQTLQSWPQIDPKAG